MAAQRRRARTHERRVKYLGDDESSHQPYCTRCRDLGIPELLPLIQPYKYYIDLRKAEAECVNALVQRLLFDLEGVDRSCIACQAVFNTGVNNIIVRCTDDRRRLFVLNEYRTRLYARGKSNDVGPLDPEDDLSEDEVFRPQIPLTRNKSSAQVCENGMPNKEISYKVLRHFLDLCAGDHPTCYPPTCDELRSIALIDVMERRLVPYPTSGICEYVALSYVWGSVEPLPFHYGDLPPFTRRTIDDAMVVVKGLGLRYLWADMLCTDQGDELHLSAQIEIMNSIYSGAFATIIALDGTDADAGLPGVSSARRPQDRAQFGNNLLLSEGLSLEYHLMRSPWSSRAWTYQEAMFSRRCLIWSESEVYFLCNDIQSSEFAGYPFYRNDVVGESETIAFRNPFIGLVLLEDTSARYKVFVAALANYVCRDLTKAGDRLRAVAGLLEQFRSTLFPDGFHYGLPKEDFRLSVSWVCRKTGDSNPGIRNKSFPSWSWAGWQLKGHLNIDDEEPGAIFLDPPHLSIKTLQGECLLTGESEPPSSRSPPKAKKGNIKRASFLARFNVGHSTSTAEDMVISIPAPSNTILEVCGVIIDLQIAQLSRARYPRVKQDCTLKTCAGKVWLGTAYIDDYHSVFQQSHFGSYEAPTATATYSFLLLAFSSTQCASSKRAVKLRMLLLRWERDVTYRCGLVYAYVERPELHTIDDAKPQLSRFLLG